MQIFSLISLKITLLFLFLTRIASKIPPRNLQYEDSDSSDNTFDPDVDLASGEIALYPNSQYYVAYVYIQNNLTLPDLSFSFTYPMILSLYTTETLMPSNCSSFLNYSDFCSAFTCLNTTMSPQTLYLPYFEAIGDTATFNIYMDLNTTFVTPSLISSSCVMGPNSAYGSGIFGILGMGTEGLSPNSSATQYFSIYLSPYFLDSRLLFYFDPNRAQYPSPIATLQANSNWNISGTSSIQMGNQTLNVSNVSMIFDINSQAIFLPYNIYSFVMSVIQQQITCYGSENNNVFPETDNTDQSDADNNTTNANTTSNTGTNTNNTDTETDNSEADSDIYDSSDTPFPICAYTYDNIHALPWINITVGNQVIPIHPAIYVRTGTGLNQTILLNLITTNISEFSEYYVTPNYQNTIILGSNFMSYYYTLFDGQNGTNTISLYLANHDPILSSNSNTTNTTNSGAQAPDTSSSGSSDLVIIILSVACGVLLMICLVVLIWCCIHKRKINTNNEQKEMDLVSLENSFIKKTQGQYMMSGIHTAITNNEKSVL